MNNRTIITPVNLDLKGLKGNELKTLIQNDVVDHSEVLSNLVGEITTGFGKTNIAILKIRKNKGKVINIIVPKLNLKAQWEERLMSNGLLNYVNVYVINSYVTGSEKVLNYQPDILIIDEGHRALNEESIYFSQLLLIHPESQVLILSASLDEKHKKYLDSLGINNYYVITRNWAYLQGLVPFHTPINVPIDLTPEEMSNYLGAADIINHCAKWFANAHVFNAYGNINPEIVARQLNVKVGAVHGLLKKWRYGITQRKQILYNAENKKVIAKEILQLINEKCLVFCKSINFAEQLVENDPLGVVYHSKLKVGAKKEALNQFFSDTKPHLVSVDTIKEGFDVVDCRVVLRTAYETNIRDTIQVTGRISRFDENNLDKQSFLINFYVRSFEARGKTVESKELEWLNKNQALEYNVVWFDTADDAINYVKETFQK